MALSPKEMQEAIVANLKQKTRRDLKSWISIARKSNFTNRSKLVRWLKSEHELGHVTAQVIASHSLENSSEYADEAKLLAALFPKNLQKQFSTIEKLLLKCAPGVERVVCKTYVGFRVKKQFAAVRVTGESVSVALALPKNQLDLAPTRFRGGGRMTHEIKLSTPGDFRTLKVAAKLAVETQSS